MKSFSFKVVADVRKGTKIFVINGPIRMKLNSTAYTHFTSYIFFPSQATEISCLPPLHNNSSSASPSTHERQTTPSLEWHISHPTSNAAEPQPIHITDHTSSIQECGDSTSIRQPQPPNRQTQRPIPIPTPPLPTARSMQILHPTSSPPRPIIPLLPNTP